MYFITEYNLDKRGNILRQKQRTKNKILIYWYWCNINIGNTVLSDKSLSLTPNWFLSHSRGIVWSVVLNAALRSGKRSTEVEFESVAVIVSCSFLSFLSFLMFSSVLALPCVSCQFPVSLSVCLSALVCLGMAFNLLRLPIHLRSWNPSTNVFVPRLFTPCFWVHLATPSQ